MVNDIKTGWQLVVDTFLSKDGGKATSENAMLLSKGKEHEQ